MSSIQAVTITTPDLPSAQVELTHNAAAKIKELIQEEGNPNLMLRVYITGGGCSGFQYGFAFEESQNPDDIAIEKIVADEGGSGGMAAKLLVDPMSLQYLIGAEIDYKEDVSGAQFIIRNPNAQTTCGCGSSFNV
jgi:iron-sulfur cluster insertion protein